MCWGVFMFIAWWCFGLVYIWRCHLLWLVGMVGAFVGCTCLVKVVVWLFILYFIYLDVVCCCAVVFWWVG